MSVPEIFAHHGEGRFREMERRCVARALEDAGVVALGGGSLLDPTTRALLRGRALVVLLWTPLDVALGRVASATRPLIDTGSDPARLYAPRITASLDLADLVISSAGPDPDDLADLLTAELRHAGLSCEAP